MAGIFNGTGKRDEGICSGAQIVHHYYVYITLEEKYRERERREEMVIKQVLLQSIAAATWNMGN